jgi:sulfofructose kinase
VPDLGRPARVLCFGFVVADRVYELDTLPTGEGKYTARGYRESGGGIAGTAAVAIAALGGSGVFCGAVGDDAAGTFLRDEMARMHVDLRGLQVIAGMRTPSASVLVDAQGERCLVVDRGTVSPNPPDPTLFADLGAVLVDHRHPVAATALMQAIAPGVPRVLDGEGGDAGDLRRLVARAEYPIFSRSGLRIASGEADPERGLRRIVAPAAIAVAVTLGEAGSLWLIDGVSHHVPATRVAVRDTTGCGDVFHGAFALAVAEGQVPLRAASFASAAAAVKASRGAGWHGMPDRQSVELMLLGRN